MQGMEKNEVNPLTLLFIGNDFVSEVASVHEVLIGVENLQRTF